MVPSILLVLLFMYKHHLSLTHHNLDNFSNVKFKISMSISNDHKIFHLELKKYLENLRAIKVAFTDQTLLCVYNDLFSHGVLHLKQKRTRLSLIENSGFLSSNTDGQVYSVTTT